MHDAVIFASTGEKEELLYRRAFNFLVELQHFSLKMCAAVFIHAHARSDDSLYIDEAQKVKTL